MSGICNFEGCQRDTESRGLCAPHAAQARRGVDLKPLRKVVLGTVQDRLEAHTDRGDGCWIWTGGMSRGGYGAMGVDGRMLPAHRVAYELEYGPIAPGLVIDHKCFTHSCVRPDHLQSVTHKQNIENRSGLDKNNTSGVRGVSWDRKNSRWQAKVHHFGKVVHVGRFERLEDAEAAVVAKRNELFSNNTLDRNPAHLWTLAGEA